MSAVQEYRAAVLAYGAMMAAAALDDVKANRELPKARRRLDDAVRALMVQAIREHRLRYAAATADEIAAELLPKEPTE